MDQPPGRRAVESRRSARRGRAPGRRPAGRGPGPPAGAGRPRAGRPVRPPGCPCPSGSESIHGPSWARPCRLGDLVGRRRPGRATAMLPPMVVGKRWASWPTQPIRLRTSSCARSSREVPPSRAVPDSRPQKRSRTLTMLLLPAPLGPTTARWRPAGTSRRSPSSTARPAGRVAEHGVVECRRRCRRGAVPGSAGSTTGTGRSATATRRSAASRWSAMPGHGVGGRRPPPRRHPSAASGRTATMNPGSRWAAMADGRRRPAARPRRPRCTA